MLFCSSAEPHPANCLTALKKKKKFRKGKQPITIFAFHIRERDHKRRFLFLNVGFLIMILRLASFSKYSWRRLLLQSRVFILVSSVPVLFPCAPPCQGTESKSSSQVYQLSPHGVFLSLERQGYWTRERCFGYRNFQTGPSTLRFFSPRWSHQVTLFKGTRNQLELFIIKLWGASRISM